MDRLRQFAASKSPHSLLAQSYRNWWRFCDRNRWLFSIGMAGCFWSEYALIVLPLQSNSQTSRPFPKRRFASFENFTNDTPNLGVLKPPRPIRNLRQGFVRVRPRLRNNNLIGICVDYEVRIMRNNDHLTVRLSFDEQLH